MITCCLEIIEFKLCQFITQTFLLKKIIIILPSWQEVGPDVERLIGQLEQAQDAVCCWAARVSVPWNDAIFMENLKTEKTNFL